MMQEPNERTRLVPGQRSCCFLVWLKPLFAWFFTDWPWQTMKYISMPETIPQKAFEKQKRHPNTDSASGVSFTFLITEAVIMVIFVLLFRLSFILCALVAQLMTCFRRDWINTNFTTVSIHNAPEEKLSCNDKVEVVTGLFIPDIVIILLAFWVYYGLKFGGQYCCGWKELKAVMRADTADSLNIWFKLPVIN